MTAAPRPGAGDGTTSNRTADERKEEHGGEEGQCHLGGREADGGRSALASLAGERADGERGVTSLAPASAAHRTTALIGEGSGRVTMRRRAGGGQRCVRTGVVGR